MNHFIISLSLLNTVESPPVNFLETLSEKNQNIIIKMFVLYKDLAQHFDMVSWLYQTYLPLTDIEFLILPFGSFYIFLVLPLVIGCIFICFFFYVSKLKLHVMLLRITLGLYPVASFWRQKAF